MPAPHEPQPQEPKSLMRALGEFFGHIRGSITHDPAGHTTHEREQRIEGDRRITVERTTTERMTIEPLEGRDQIG